MSITCVVCGNERSPTVRDEIGFQLKGRVCSIACKEQLAKQRKERKNKTSPARREYLAANREHIRKREREYDEANRVRIRARRREWLAATGYDANKYHKNKVLAYMLLKQLGMPLDHLPTHDHKLQFSFRLLKQFPGVLPPLINRNKTND
jgi:hypothetical protein